MAVLQKTIDFGLFGNIRITLLTLQQVNSSLTVG
jgi:hypothetical protein